MGGKGQTSTFLNTADMVNGVLGASVIPYETIFPPALSIGTVFAGFVSLLCPTIDQDPAHHTRRHPLRQPQRPATTSLLAEAALPSIPSPTPLSCS